MPRLNYSRISATKARRGIEELVRKAREMDEPSVIEAVAYCLECLSNGEKPSPAILDFVAAADKLFRLGAQFNYDNSSCQIIYTMAGSSADYRVLSGRLWDVSSSYKSPNTSTTTTTTRQSASLNPTVKSFQPRQSSRTPSSSTPATMAEGRGEPMIKLSSYDSKATTLVTVGSTSGEKLKSLNPAAQNDLETTVASNPGVPDPVWLTAVRENGNNPYEVNWAIWK